MQTIGNQDGLTENCIVSDLVFPFALRAR